MKCLRLPVLITVLLLLSVFSAQAAYERWAMVLPTTTFKALLNKHGSGDETYAVFGDETVVFGKTNLLEALTKSVPPFPAMPFRQEEEAWLLTSKDPLILHRTFPGVRTVWKGFGMKVVLVNETAQMGMKVWSSPFTRLDPIPRNRTIVTPPRAPNPFRRRADKTEEVLGNLDMAAFEKDLKSLVDFKTRYSFSAEAELSMKYCEKIFAGFEMKTRRVKFGYYGGADCDSLEAILPGSDRAMGEVLIVGHIDSTSPRPRDLAPGADDNGSGAAGVLALARFIRAGKFAPKATIRFVLFRGEEQGLLGSKAYVESFKPEELKKMKAVINLDMIGFDETLPVSVLMETYSSHESFVNDFQDAAANYTDLITSISYNPWGSDHMPFLKKEIPAVLTIESEFDANPNYHKTTDLIKDMNLELCRQILRMNAVVMLRKAGVLD